MTSVTLGLPTTPTGRIRVLDELKGLAIILIVLYHAGGVLAWENRLHGEIGVDIFVILSGIGLALSKAEGSWRAFCTRRLLRIFPAYWIVLTAFIFANTYTGSKPAPFDCFVHYLGIHAFFGDTYAMSINDSFWFISLIIFVYFVYAFMRPILHRTDWVIGIGAILSLVVTLTFLLLNQPVCYTHLGSRLPGFFLGIIAGQLIRNGRIEVPLNWIVAISVFLLTYVAYLESVIFYSALLGWIVMAFYAFGWRQVAPALIGNSFGKALEFLGRHSLEIFLLHQPIIRQYNIYFQSHVLKKAYLTPTSVIVGMAVAFLVVVLLSVGLRQAQEFLNRRLFDRAAI